MLNSSLGLYLVCGVPTVINKTEVWSDHDKYILNTAKQRCGEKFPEAPCLTTFVKKEELVYWAICGEKE